MCLFLTSSPKLLKQAGYIRTNKNEYLIEPSKNQKMSGSGHPHVVFHRSAVKNNQESDKKGTQKKRKKKRKRRHSNCGTKEPRKSAETKIEWQPQGKVNIFLRRALA
jgi:hypothetical protein